MPYIMCPWIQFGTLILNYPPCRSINIMSDRKQWICNLQFLSSHWWWKSLNDDDETLYWAGKTSNVSWALEHVQVQTWYEFNIINVVLSMFRANDTYEVFTLHLWIWMHHSISRSGGFNRIASSDIISNSIGNVAIVSYCL